MPELSTEFWIATVLAVITLLLGLGVTLAMDSKTKGEFRFAVSCFVFSALMGAAMIGAWSMNTSESAVKRVVLTGLLFAIVGIMLVESIRWTHGRHVKSGGSEHNNSTNEEAPIEQTPVPPSRQTLAPRPARGTCSHTR